MKQLRIARKDLNMSPGKLAAQVSHASMAFLTTQIQNHKLPNPVGNQWIIALPIDFQATVDTKQNITDNTLTTTAKTVVGGINEVNEVLDTYLTQYEIAFSSSVAPSGTNTHTITNLSKYLKAIINLI